MSKKIGNESRFGSLPYLLKGGAKPRRSYALMIALVLVAFMSFAGVVSADNYWKGAAPKTEVSGTVNGGVDVLYADTWKTTDNPVSDSAWANFTLSTDPSNVKFARLYVLVYMGNMTANYKGTEDIAVYPNGANPVLLTDAQPLELDYDRTVGPSYIDVYDYTSIYIQNISRVTSDYLNVFDINDAQTLGRNVNVSIMTTNRSDILGNKFDGRIKEAKLVYGWDTTTNPKDTQYWINEGHDTMTKDLVAPYYGQNKTTFSSVNNNLPYTAKLWVDYSGYTSSAKGKYTWNDVTLPTTTGTGYTYSFTSGTYGGLHTWEWTNSSTLLGLSATDSLTYTNTTTWYKIPLAVLTVKH